MQAVLGPLRRLEYEARACTMEERLAQAVSRMSSVKQGDVNDSRHTLRQEQIGVFVDFSRFLSLATDSQYWQGKSPSGRIVLPPRTGKTVIAGQIIAATGLMTTFIVPTRTLVEQTARALREQLIGIPVGTFYGEEKQVVMWGVNVTTYSILQRHFRDHGCLPVELRHSALVFADEGHRSLTVGRQEMLTNAFDPLAMRVALTATPNYNAKRRLVAFYRELIHEISISEAVELEMVAPVRVWIAAVDVDGSRITMRAGDYDERKLGTIMKRAPFFEAARRFRYDPMQLGKAALVCCASRKQAMSLHRYWMRRLPAGRPEPVVLLGTTPKEERLEALRKFEAGEIDTLINVGVLIEGWSSPRCKLLIDLAPSCSWVRATQKFFRPLTKWEEREAAIFMLVPKDLPVRPVVPMDLFEWNTPAFEQGLFIGSRRQQEQAKKRAIRWAGIDHIKQVIARTDIIFNVKFEKPKLDPQNDRQIARVLCSVSEFRQGSLPLFGAFRKIVFRHKLFAGRGENLLRYCQVPINRHDYLLFMARFFPEAASSLFCQSANYNLTGGQIDEALGETPFVSLDEFVENAGAAEVDVFGRPEAYPDPADLIPALRQPSFREESDGRLFAEELREAIINIFRTLSFREREVLKLRLGLLGLDYEHTFEQIAVIFRVSRERVRQVEVSAMMKLRMPVRKARLRPWYDPNCLKIMRPCNINGRSFARVDVHTDQFRKYPDPVRILPGRHPHEEVSILWVNTSHPAYRQAIGTSDLTRDVEFDFLRREVERLMLEYVEYMRRFER